MRLGSYPCILEEKTKAFSAYGKNLINERHRHRYEFNNQFKEEISAKGMVIAGSSPDGELVEIVELKDHRWFVGVQFHPELKSRVHKPHPLFTSFVAEAKKYRNESSVNHYETTSNATA